MQRLQNKQLLRDACFINGAWQQANNREMIAVDNPFDGAILGHVPRCGREETKAAIHAAASAFPIWKNFSAKERSEVMWRFAQLIDANKEDLATLMTLEQGKPIVESRGEMDYANSFIKWFAEEGRRVYGDVIPSNKREQHLIVIKEPIGVVAAITPWNFPAAMITRKIAPSLAVGCTIVIKPASETPLTALALAYLAECAGFPAGVFNMLTGDAKAIGAEMTENSLVRKVSFTGSTEVGRLLMAESAPTIKKLSLELGGNAPFIVFDDANIDAAVKGCIASKFRNTGQTCVCANRIFVQDTVYDTFTTQLISAIKELKIGNGLDEEVRQGPLINEKALEKVKEHVADAKQKGGQILLGGNPHALGGLFFEPTVITDANPSMRLYGEETFGPVAPLFRFHEEDEAIAMANDTIFGLASYFYSSQMERIWHVSENLAYGMVGVNTGILSTEVAPFGGIKQSGIGREGSKYGIDDYVDIKYLCMGTGK